MEFEEYWHSFFGQETLSYETERRRFRLTNKIYEKIRERTKSIPSSLPIDEFEVYIGSPESEDRLVLFDRMAIKAFVQNGLEDRIEIDNRNLERVHPDKQQRVAIPERMAEELNDPENIVLASSRNGEYFWIERPS